MFSRADLKQKLEENQAEKMQLSQCLFKYL